MSPRFMSRMASKNAMQLEWHRHHSSPPSYQQQQEQQQQQHPQSQSNYSPPISPISPTTDENPPTYQRAARSISAPPAYIQPHHHHHQTNHPPIIDLYSFPPQSTILVVGAYTRQGMHIIDALLSNNHSVRGIVSNAREAAQVAKHFEASHGRGCWYTSIIVGDMTREGALDATARGCGGVVFVAAGLHHQHRRRQSISMLGGENNEERVSILINALTSAVKERGVVRFVYCSSPSSPSPVAAGTHPPLLLNNSHHQISTISEDGDDDECASQLTSYYHAVTTTTTAQQQQPLPPSQWLSRSRSRSRSSSRSSTSLEESSSSSSIITEETPIEIALGKWIDLWEPRFALQTGESFFF
jgi:hypothetical protein